MKTLSFVTGIICLSFSLFSQNKLFQHAFSFDKKSIDSNWCNTYLTTDKNNKSVIITLKDANSVRYLLVSDDFKKKEEIAPQGLAGTVFSIGTMDYMSGRAENNIGRFIYSATDGTVYQEELDFTKKTVVVKKIFDKPKNESLLCSFMSNDIFKIITMNDDTGELVFYETSDNQSYSKKTVKYPFPDYINQKVVKLSGLMSGLKMINEGDEVDLETGRAKRKLYIFNNRLMFVIDAYESPTQLVTISLPTMQIDSKIIKHERNLQVGKGEHYYVNSSYSENSLFSHVSQKNKIVLLVYDLTNDKLVKQHNITAETSLTRLAQSPISISTANSKKTETELKKMKEVIKKIYDGTNVLSVNKLQGDLILTIGHYNILQNYEINTSQSSDIGVRTFNMRTKNTITGYTPMIYTVWEYSPIRITSVKPDGFFYEATYFKIALDNNSLEVISDVPDIGKRNNDIKKYVNDKAKDKINPVYFELAGKDYFAYYDKMSKKFEIEEIVHK